MTLHNIQTFILYSPYEKGRDRHINILKQQISHITFVEAIFPKYEKVPFINRLIKLSKTRTGKSLNQGEIGCLLGHRKIWHMIAKNSETPHQHFLVLESDSKIINIVDFKKIITELVNSKNLAASDLFFWGAWNGNTRIKKSTASHILNK